MSEEATEKVHPWAEAEATERVGLETKEEKRRLAEKAVERKMRSFTGLIQMISENTHLIIVCYCFTG